MLIASNRMKGKKGNVAGENSSNDESTIDEICRDTWIPLYRFVYYKVQNREEAEDITQETYAKAIDYLSRNNVAVLEYLSFLKTIAMNIIRDQWRIKKKKGQVINIDEVNPEAMANEDFAIAATDRAVINEAMQKLTPEQKDVIIYRIIKGYSSAETATLMKKKESTVRVILFRALKALTKLIKEKE